MLAYEVFAMNQLSEHKQIQ